jgi:hypothetical protein
VRAKIVRHCRAELIRLQPGGALLNYVLPNSPRVRRVEMDEAQHRALVRGEYALVEINADVRFAMRSEETPKTFGRRAKRYYSGGPATSTKAPDEGDLGLMKAAAARELREMDPRLVLFLRKRGEAAPKHAVQDEAQQSDPSGKGGPAREPVGISTPADASTPASEKRGETSEVTPAMPPETGESVPPPAAAEVAEPASAPEAEESTVSSAPPIAVDIAPEETPAAQ